MKGRKTGGRVRGVPNRKTQELAAKLAKLGCDPVEALAKIADDRATPLDIRVTCYRELAGYLYPKRKAVDVAHEGPPLVLHFGASDALL
jgi:hypothetical protein